MTTLKIKIIITIITVWIMETECRRYKKNSLCMTVCGWWETRSEWEFNRNTEGLREKRCEHMHMIICQGVIQRLTSSGDVIIKPGALVKVYLGSPCVCTRLSLLPSPLKNTPVAGSCVCVRLPAAPGAPEPASWLTDPSNFAGVTLCTVPL